MNPKTSQTLKISAIAIIALLGAGIVGTSWYVGKRLENLTAEQLAKLKQEVPYLKVVSQKNSYGLFSSTQDITFGLEPGCFQGPNQSANAADAFKDLSFGIRNRIQHGPIAIANGVHLGLAYTQGELVFPAALQPAIKSVFGEQPALSWKGTMRFSGDQELAVTSPAVTQKRPDVMFSWEGLQGIIKTTVPGGYDIQLNAPSLRVIGQAEPVAKLNIEKLTFAAKGQRNADNLNLGDGSFGVGQMIVSLPFFGEANINNFKIQAESKLDGGFVNVNENFDLTNFEMGGNKYGPFSLQLAFNHLHAASLAKLSKEFQKLSCNKSANINAELNKILEASKTIALELLKNKPEFSLKQLRVNLPEGEFLAKGNAVLESITSTSIADTNALMADIMSHLAVNFEATTNQGLPLSYAKQQAASMLKQRLMAEQKNFPSEQEFNQLVEQQAKEQLLWLTAQNIVQAEGDKYKLVFKLQKGQATLNGVAFQPPVPIPGLAAEVPAAAPANTPANIPAGAATPAVAAEPPQKK